MFTRVLKDRLIDAALKHPVITLLGPKGAGKTTLIQSCFSYAYVTMEDLDTRDFARSDPWNFLYHHYDPTGSLIIDEIQYLPQLLPYIEQVVRKKPFPGSFILTSSRRLPVEYLDSQSIAFTLLPPSIGEIETFFASPTTLETQLFRGCFPSVLNGDVTPEAYYSSMVHTFVEKELPRQLKVFDPDAFTLFIKLCAGRIGQAVNFSSLGHEVGVSHNTAKSWLSLLEDNYFTFFLQPYQEGYGKRAVKTAKLYFYDTGLACWLLGIRSAEQLATHYLKAELFKSLIISNFIKQKHHHALAQQYYFWQDKSGNEVDCLIEEEGRLRPIDIKAGRTTTPQYFERLMFWNSLAKQDPTHHLVIYAGDQQQENSQGLVLGWRSVENIELLTTEI